MPQDLSKKEIKAQSLATFGKWRNLWIYNSKCNKDLPNSHKLSELIDIGKGKVLLQVAFGNSLKQNIDKIKKYRDKYDIFACDKTFKYLMENGIVPDLCMVADAQVEDKWFKDDSGNYLDTSKTKLISNVSSNPEWTYNWKGPVYLFTNFDNIGSHKILGHFGNCYGLIPASSNVGNALIVIATVVFNYDWQILVGMDFCWKDDQYYATGDPMKKRYYMNHIQMALNGEIVHTSLNLLFSCRWISQFLSTFNLNVINTSDGLLDGALLKTDFNNAVKVVDRQRTICR